MLSCIQQCFQDIMSTKYTSQTASIQAFGLVLKALQYEDLPSFLYWRNKQNVRNAMPITDKISYSSLHFWYKKQEHSSHSYSYLAYLDNTPIAFTDLINIDYEGSRGEGGLFIFDDRYLATGIAYHIVLCKEILMHYLNIRTLISKMKLDNTESIKFCESYGGRLVRQEGDMLIYASEYNERRSALKRIASLIRREQDFQTYLGDSEV